jgi:chorismate mutase
MRENPTAHGPVPGGDALETRAVSKKFCNYEEKEMACRGIRGAVTIEINDAGTIVAATRDLLERIAVANGVLVDDITSVIFTTTPDLDAAYPARAAREMGWVNVPLLCMQEMVVVGSLLRCVRVLLHYNTDRPIDQIRHVYVGEAQSLRPDLARGQGQEKE